MERVGIQKYFKDIVHNSEIVWDEILSLDKVCQRIWQILYQQVSQVMCQ